MKLSIVISALVAVMGLQVFAQDEAPAAPSEPQAYDSEKPAAPAEEPARTPAKTHHAKKASKKKHHHKKHKSH